MTKDYINWYTPSYLPVKTICKFYANHDSKHPNPIFTRSLLKIGFIHHDWLDEHPEDEKPQEGEFWQVNVVRETRVSENKGCFLLEPIQKVEPKELNRLLPGMFTSHNNNGCLIVEPKTQGHNWIMPLKHRHAISPKDDEKAPYAIIVTLD